MLRRAVLSGELVLAAIDAYLLTLLIAAAAPQRRCAAAPAGAPELVVLVPAHDEAAAIGACLDALAASAAGGPPMRTVVVADNCSDATADIGRARGATVLERRDPVNRGKGHALNWALERVDLDGAAVAVVDADCTVSPDFASAVAGVLGRGADAVQVPYVVANADESTATALRAAAFALINTVRPQGRSRLGLSAGLMGTGMAFAAGLLPRYRFHAASLVEDADLHLRLLLDGRRVQFAPTAQVRSPMPTRRDAIQAQQSRWEGGRGQLLRRYLRPLLARAVRSRDAAALSAAVELCVPPMSVLALAHVLVAAAAWPAGRQARRLALAANAGQAAFVVGGLCVARAPASTYRSLLAAPLLVARKLRVLADIAVEGAPSSWQRTARDGAPGSGV